jgi:hypothetical protein
MINHKVIMIGFMFTGMLGTSLCLNLADCHADDMLADANANFSYKSKPIHPFLVQEFSNWLSDARPPIVATVDVQAASDSNRYGDSDVEQRDDWWFATKEETDGDISLYESFGYHWIGKLDNGTHVLETGSSGGGSGFFMDLILVKFSIGTILYEGQRTEQLLMTVVGYHSLGDRYEGKIRIEGNRVVMPASDTQSGGGSVGEEMILVVK